MYKVLPRDWFRVYGNNNRLTRHINSRNTHVDQSRDDERPLQIIFLSFYFHASTIKIQQIRGYTFGLECIKKKKINRK